MLRFAILIVAVSLAQISHADDLLNILENSATQSMPGLQKRNQVSKLRDLVRSSGTQITAEQNIFISFFEAGQLNKALYQWGVAFDKTNFSTSASGQALHSWLIFQNGLQLSGVESLLKIASPQSIDAFILEQWKTNVPANHQVWSQVSSSLWTSAWEKVFGVDVGIRILGKNIYRANDAELLKTLLGEAQPGSTEFAWLLWQDVLMGIDKDTSTSAQKLAQLMKLNNSTINVNLLNITAARLLYQNGYLDAAIKYYEKVEKKSDYWFEAQEEMAWAYLRKGEPQNALATVKSITRPEFVKWAGPEALYLRTIAELKICDYPAVVNSLTQFRTSFKERAGKLALAAKGEATESYQKVGDTLKKSGSLTVEKLGTLSESVPRFALRDKELAKIVIREVRLAQEAKEAGKLYSSSLSEGTGQVGFQAGLDQLRLTLQQRVEGEVASRNNRIKTLAERELKEISDILQKMHIIEAEVISQTTLVDRVAESKSGKKKIESGTTGSKDPYALVFAGSQESWFDEIGNYRVEVKGACGSVTK